MIATFFSHLSHPEFFLSHGRKYNNLPSALSIKPSINGNQATGFVPLILTNEAFQTGKRVACVLQPASVRNKTYASSVARCFDQTEPVSGAPRRSLTSLRPIFSVAVLGSIGSGGFIVPIFAGDELDEV
uniref:Uncharacterized protein n=1 Tax=Anopheles culicifacies TaxID=139723 RepID=A0A182MRR1_9DIPT